MLEGLKKAVASDNELDNETLRLLSLFPPLLPFSRELQGRASLV